MGCLSNGSEYVYRWYAPIIYTTLGLAKRVYSFPLDVYFPFWILAKNWRLSSLCGPSRFEAICWRWMWGLGLFPWRIFVKICLVLNPGRPLFFTLISWRSLHTPFSVTSRLSMSGYCWAVFGIIPSDVLKTDLNCFKRISALLEFSYCSVRSFFRVDTPILSLFLLFI